MKTRGYVIGAVVAAVVAAAAAIALIGGDGESEQASIEAPPAPAPDAPGAAPGKADGASKPVSKKSAPKAPAAESEGEPPDPDQIREQIERVVPPARRNQFAQLAAAQTLRTFGFPSVDVRVNANGRVVTVFIPPGDACAVELAEIPKVKRAVRKVVLFARKIRLKVYGWGGLAAYVRDNCKPLEPPDAPGPVVFSASGTGIRGSELFNITSNRFTVAWANNSGNLEIYVTEGQRLVEPIIKSQKRETGKQTYPGPGTFRVAITGSGTWSVRVHDGA